MSTLVSCLLTFLTFLTFSYLSYISFFFLPFPWHFVELVIKKSNSSEEREKDNEAILNQLIPFSFDSLSETVIAKVRNVLHKIDKALRLHQDPKDRIKELRVIGSKLEFDINRKNDDFLFVEAVAITNIASKVEGKQLVQNMNQFLTEFPEFPLSVLRMANAEKNSK